MNLNKEKSLPIGIDDFRDIIHNNYYYFDKSDFIKDIIDQNSKVSLILRPRRFGKTLNLSMLKYYFDLQQKDENLFKKLAIWQAGEKYQQAFAQYPVIFISLKEIKAASFNDAFAEMKLLFAKLYRQYDYLLESQALINAEKNRFQAILDKQGDFADYTNALSDLCLFLNQHHGKKVVLLLDEYDTPIHQALEYDYVKDMLAFMGPFLGNALKGNPNLHFSVITGILKIAKENLFSDLNNIKVYTTLSGMFSRHFGLLESEVEQILQDYAMTESITDIGHWYNGYCFGQQSRLYNPWSIINYVHDNVYLKEGFQPYWVNTSGTAVIEKALAAASGNVKMELELLLKDENLIVEIDENISLRQKVVNPTSIWSVLLSSGYLTTRPNGDLELPKHSVRIPNREVKQAFEKIIKLWFINSANDTYLRDLTQYLIKGEVESFAELFSNYIETTLSYFDVDHREPERFYHALMLGILIHLKGSHQIKSNRESGIGRYDVMLIPNDKTLLGIIIEFKKVSQFRKETLESAGKAALQQIADKKYAQELQALGINTILSLAIVFEGKQVAIYYDPNK